MAIGTPNPENINTGWGAAPTFSAPSIGSLVTGVLENRYRQQKLQQDTIADAIKQYQSQRSDAAYIQAAQNAGVLPQGDYSGMSAKEASDLAQRIQDMTPDTDVDKLHQAMARYYNAGADAGGRGGRGGAGVDYSEHSLGDTWIDEDSGIRMIMTKQGPKIAQGFTQPNQPSRPRDISTYTKGNDIDADSAWEDPKDPNNMQVPTLDPNYDPAKPVGPKNQMYRQAVNPNYDPNGPKDATNPPTFTHTVPVPKKVWNAFRNPGGTGGDQTDQTDTGNGQGQGTGGGKGKYNVGDPVTLKDGSTHKVIAVNPDGSYQVD